MNVTGNTQVVTQIPTPTSTLNTALTLPNVPLSSLAADGDMKPPKTSSRYPLCTHVRNDRRFSGRCGIPFSRTATSAASAAATSGCTPRSASISADVRRSVGSWP